MSQVDDLYYKSLRTAHVVFKDYPSEVLTAMIAYVEAEYVALKAHEKFTALKEAADKERKHEPR